jgi:glutamate racemase
MSMEITTFLEAQGSSLITVACNTASAAALHHLRQSHPLIGFVGLEPAVKPAAKISRTGTIAVLGTTATIDGPLLDDVIQRFAEDTSVLSIALPGLADLVEAGLADSPQVDDMLAKNVTPALEAG